MGKTENICGLDRVKPYINTPNLDSRFAVFTNYPLRSKLDPSDLRIIPLKTFIQKLTENQQAVFMRIDETPWLVGGDLYLVPCNLVRKRSARLQSLRETCFPVSIANIMDPNVSFIGIWIPDRSVVNKTPLMSLIEDVEMEIMIDAEKKAGMWIVREPEDEINLLMMEMDGARSGSHLDSPMLDNQAEIPSLVTTDDPLRPELLVHKNENAMEPLRANGIPQPAKRSIKPHRDPRLTNPWYMARSRHDSKSVKENGITSNLMLSETNIHDSDSSHAIDVDPPDLEEYTLQAKSLSESMGLIAFLESIAPPSVDDTAGMEYDPIMPTANVNQGDYR